ncbi:MAG: YajD family HNH nuclease [Acidiferrobacterales bacterium]|jgi:5-methylcytosine-specific restriction endonuclease McrA|nr:YajD family HNH nuclease [Acidiferrobacterales bacterium]
MPKSNDDKLNKLVAESRRAAEKREQDYREQALKMYPHICGRCGREFNRDNLQELTVHHRDHNHDNNPADGSNWELLCIYCHDNEHQRQLEAEQAGGTRGSSDSKNSTYNPFADLKSLLDQKK